MNNTNGSNVSLGVEKDAIEETERGVVEENNNLIGVLKPIDIMNSDNQSDFNRVHVFCCNKCDFLTISIESLQQHLRMRHAIPSDVFNELAIYSCQECQCVSTELKLIKEHIKMFHDVLQTEISLKKTSGRTTHKPRPIGSATVKIHRKSVQNKLIKKQLKIHKKLMNRKSHPNPSRILFSDFYQPIKSDQSEEKRFPDLSGYEMNTENETNPLDEKIDQEPPPSFAREQNDENDENDPLDMSISSITCPFKGIKTESLDRSVSHMKPEFLLAENVESLINCSSNNGNNNNSIINNPLLTNPQTCIELIKLTLGQMLAKSNDQSRLPIPGFNPASFLQPQFQLPPNIIPLLLPTLATVSNSNATTTQPDLSFSTQNADIDAILSNLQQQNILKSVSANSYDQNHHLLSQSSLFLNHKSARSSPNVSKNLFIESIPKNGNGALSPIYNSKKSNDCHSKLPPKRQFKKNQIQSRNRNGMTDNLSYLKNSDQNNENLFNRSFLDSSLSLENKSDQLDLSKVLEKHDSSCDLFDSHTNTSNKSSPGGLTSDKPHRQNFTSQQNRILSDWFFAHCDKPYPSTEDTKELSQFSGLTYSQVKKWFANKRARSSLNKKGHKNYCLITPAESTIEEMGGNSELCQDGLLAISPSSGSQNAYNSSSIIKTSSSQHTSPIPLDYTQLHQEELQSSDK